jgi:hypothetical protein
MGIVIKGRFDEKNARFDPRNSQEVRTVYVLCKKNMFIDTVCARTDDQ